MYKCYAFLHSKRNEEINKSHLCYAGYANGYVAIPPEHPLFGKSYDEATAAGIDTHGGLTFAEKSDLLVKYWDSHLELLDGQLPEGYWVFGFDTMHYSDNLETCPREYVVEVVTRLKHNLENFEL